MVIHNGHLVALLEGEENRANNSGLILPGRRKAKFDIFSCLTQICLTPMVLQDSAFGDDTRWLLNLVLPRSTVTEKCCFPGLRNCPCPT